MVQGVLTDDAIQSIDFFSFDLELFDRDFYLAANPDVAAAGFNDEELINHFRTNGIDEGRPFSLVFDFNFYRNANPDLANFSPRELFNHFRDDGLAEGRRFSPFVDLDFYIDAYKKRTELDTNFPDDFNGVESLNKQWLRLLISELNNPEIASAEVAEGESAFLFSPYMDIQEVYLPSNPDLQAAGFNLKEALQHLQLNGLNEGRRFSIILDTDFYIENNLDLQAAGLNNREALDQFILYGVDESRRPSLLYDTDYYRENNQDLKEQNLNNKQLIDHFRLTGLPEDQRQSSVYFAPRAIDALLLNQTTGEEDADADAAVASDNILNPKQRWNTRVNGTLTYSFVTDASSSLYTGVESGVGEVSEAIKNNVREIMQKYNEILPFELVEVADRPPNTGEIRIMFSNGQANNFGNFYAYAYGPGIDDINLRGDIHLSRNFENDQNQAFSRQQGTYGYESLVRQIGFALGLKNPGISTFNVLNNSPVSPTETQPYLPSFQDNNTNTAMSYNSAGLGAIGPMSYDIRALQYLYGFSDARKGNDVYSFDGSNFIGLKQTIWDGGGIDTIDFSELPGLDSYFFNMNEGGQNTGFAALNGSSYTGTSAVTDEEGNLQRDGDTLVVTGDGPHITSSYATAIGFGVLIENLIGSAVNDFIIGNNQDNNISAGDGADTITGSKGSDTITGGGGSDTFVFAEGDGADTITDYSDGIDRIGLSAGLTFDQLSITGVGADTLIRVASTGELLGILTGVPDFTINAGDFTLV
jgi:serralysin